MKYANLLLLIGTWGALTTRECAQLWKPRHSPKSALKSAQLALTELRDDGLVLTRRLPYHGTQHAYVLTKKGAAALNLHVMDEWLELQPDAKEWFSHGYELSLGNLVSRHPLVDLASRMCAEYGYTAVGKRGLQRNFMGHGKLAGDFDGVLLTPEGKVAFGLFLSDAYGTNERDKVRRLAKGNIAFLLASTNADCVAALAKVRNAARIGMEQYIRDRLPAGVMA